LRQRESLRPFIFPIGAKTQWKSCPPEPILYGVFLWCH
jgi:hypothetical protein